MWIAVQERFRRLVNNLALTDEQFEDGFKKHINIGRSLERAYYGGNFGEYPPGFMVGSWGKGTVVTPPQDIDAFFIMPDDDLNRFNARTGNVQSALLQEVKEVVSGSYPQTTIRGDGQVVVVAFNSITIEVVPVFRAGNRQYVMPDTNNGGRWKIVAPSAQFDLIDQTDRAMNGNVRNLSKIIKLWKHEKNVPLKSFIIELLVCEFLPARGNGWNNTYWYDFYVRDFFEFLLRKANTYVIIPGTNDPYFLGDDWLSRAETARDNAVSACHWEYHDYDVTAGQEWQKIFGSRIQIHVR